MKRIALTLSVFLFAAVIPAVQAQNSATTQVHDASALKPPPGARVAIVEFEDMECPMCAHVNPILKQAVATYHIPWVRHDFPLRMHVWSFDAAVDARWFDTKSKKIGDEFRDAVFANQESIATKSDLRALAEKFAQQHGIGFPFVVDPQGKLAADVTADYNLGQRIGIEHTPTIWVVTNKISNVPYVEVTDINNLYQIIDQAIADTKNEAPSGSRGHHSGTR
ncbi:MAG: thioredoxin domain-containing protein [Acidobacteriaceae bacterium]